MRDGGGARLTAMGREPYGVVTPPSLATWDVRPRWENMKMGSDASRFWPKVSPPDENGCMEWSGHRLRDHYGGFKMGGKMVVASRAAWILVNGPIPDGMKVCHRCDNPPCCNPAHLFLATQGENLADMSAKGRSLAGTAQSRAKLTEAKVRAAREAFEGGASISGLAAQYGVSRSVMGRVVHREDWQHVA